jgi:hypothetical protein
MEATGMKALEERIGKLEKLMGTPEVSGSPEILQAVRDEVMTARRRLKSLECKLIYGQLVGGYWTYTNNDRDIEYLHIKSVKGNMLVADIVNVCRWRGNFEIHMYMNAERCCDNYETYRFEPVPEDDFMSRCMEACTRVVDGMVKCPDGGSPQDFLSVHTREEVGETDRRIVAAEKEHEARMLEANRKAKDFPMTN